MSSTNKLTNDSHSSTQLTPPADLKVGQDASADTSPQKKRRKQGRPRIKPDELATERVEVRFHKSELGKFKAECAANNISVPAAIRQMVRNGRIEAPAIKSGPNWNGIDKLVLRNLAAYGNNLNQIAALLHLDNLKQRFDPVVLSQLSVDVRHAMEVLEQLKAAIRAQAEGTPPTDPKPQKKRWNWFGRAA